jgi:diadenosine tetraphosphatase ApaH/serine/threonine PP2A family protein phosphatase
MPTGAPISQAKMLARLFRSRGDATGPAATPDGTVVYAIGDIHGRADLLGDLHGRIATHAATAGRARKLVVYLGDYVDRGPNSRAVIDMLIEAPLEGFEPVYLKGNHEDAMLRFLDDTSVGPSWLGFGGQETLASYGIDLHAMAPGPGDWLDTIQAELRERLPSDHRRFLEHLALSHSEGGYFFAHAGVKPGVPLEDQRPEDLMWIRDAFLDSRRDFGAIVVHGHSIRRQPEFRTNRIGIDTGAVFTGVLSCLVLTGETRDVLQTG